MFLLLPLLPPLLLAVGGEGSAAAHHHHHKQRAHEAFVRAVADAHVEAGATDDPAPSRLGILNATLSCGVDPTGVADSTVALQACIERAYKANLALFLPAGRYLVSDTLTAAQADGGDVTPHSPTPAPVNVVPGRFRPNVLLGSTAVLPTRPTIVLKAGSPGFDNASSPKNVLKITNSVAENINMNQVIRGIDLEVQGGNPGAIALYFQGAQGGVIQDVTVRLAPDALAGFGGGGGAGTSHINVAVHGGAHGVYFCCSDGAPVVANAVLKGQSRSAVVSTGGGPLIVVGVHIVRAANATGPAIVGAPNENGRGQGGQLTVLDSVVECSNSSGRLPVISASASLYVKGLWASGCSTAVQHPTSRHSTVRFSMEPCSAWYVVHELARGVDTPGARPGNLTMDVIYHDGRRLPGATVENISSASATPPSPELLGQHVLWSESDFPSFESPTTVNAVMSCGVKGDNTTDDEPALSRCLKLHRDVFLPKGYYRLGRTLDLNPANRLVGLSQTHTVMMPVSHGFSNASGSFGKKEASAVQCTTTPQPCPAHPGATFCESDAAPHQCEAPMPHRPCPPCPSPGPAPVIAAQPLVRTAPGSPATLAFIGMNSWWHLPIFTLEWNSKGGLWRSNYETRVCECLWLANFRAPTTPCTTAIRLAVPKTQIHGTGNFVNYVSDEDILMTDRVNYRHVQVASAGSRGNASDRLRFYEGNFEHAQAQANFEVQNSSHVDIYGIKLEGSTTILWIRDSHDINLWGLGGAGDSFPSDPMMWKGTYHNKTYDFRVPADVPRYNASTVRVERTSQYKLVNLINGDRGGMSEPISQIHPIPLTPKLLSGFMWPQSDIPLIIQSEWSPWPGWRIPPILWSVAGEMNGTMDPSAILSTPMDRPVLFQRGY